MNKGMRSKGAGEMRKETKERRKNVYGKRNRKQIWQDFPKFLEFQNRFAKNLDETLYTPVIHICP